jgi:hypothetical protein
MHVKIRNGTVSNGERSLCETCRHSLIVRGRTLGEEIVRCQATPMTTTRITFKVTSCSDYHDAREPSFIQLMEQAWILQPGSKRRQAGFVRGRDLREEEFRTLVEEMRAAEGD